MSVLWTGDGSRRQRKAWENWKGTPDPRWVGVKTFLRELGFAIALVSGAFCLSLALQSLAKHWGL